MILVLTGGFLGSGKTTAIVNACRLVISKGKKAAVITNDQGNQQVDAAFVQAMGLLVKEVGNGCFCCKYHELESHLKRLEENEQPDIIFAEAVGSCTDMVATIVKPLQQRIPGMKMVVSVFADAGFVNALMEGKSLFDNETIGYIYKKQLEEADVLVINKTDLVTAEELANVDLVLTTEYPGKVFIQQNALNDVSSWMNAIELFSTAIPRNSLQVNYDVYGEGESRLAWLDKSIIIQTPLGNGAFLARTIIRSLFDQMQARNYKIGHLKFFLDGGDWKEKFSFTAMSTSGEVRIRHDNVFQLKLLINARIQTGPEELKAVVDDTIDAIRISDRCSISTENESVFKPGYPMPVYRIE